MDSISSKDIKDEYLECLIKSVYCPFNSQWGTIAGCFWRCNQNKRKRCGSFKDEVTPEIINVKLLSEILKNPQEKRGFLKYYENVPEIEEKPKITRRKVKTENEEVEEKPKRRSKKD